MCHLSKSYLKSGTFVALEGKSKKDDLTEAYGLLNYPAAGLLGICNINFSVPTKKSTSMGQIKGHRSTSFGSTVLPGLKKTSKSHHRPGSM